ncbi:sugar phosphate nucleotidyltransferase [Corynebacterium marquesiae]|nr:MULTISPECIES: sugar phosphate nucleotidyltransferase [Corynebacterium]MDK8454607.1 sugar phosphate nucleotidyltransferase [Corynebacterium marquesiae]MDK8480081.1 sugar phosphate nucleotidyltransferase [Corynebacterium marquesiae]MDK8693386.1 sugar phosphate nucleotidyltransferase [Corynebacterium sp. MSK158]MDK8724724.1 sugar phosphate nucleotidyltransferase [Corynebacterium marquesiae]MDK8769931.1 sugar phosphate nucleotidyltransferase [Corynebacterium marquesiae]
MFPDLVIEPTAAMGEMIRVRQEHGGSVLLAVEVGPPQVSNYGVFDVEVTDDDRVKKVVGMVEKPAVGDVPSNMVATGRCLLDRTIFGALRRITPGKDGELQLPDAITLLLSEGHPVHVVAHEGIRYDLGNPAGFIPTSVEFGLRHSEYGSALFTDLEVLLEKYRGEVGRGLGESRPRGESDSDESSSEWENE